VLLMVDEEAQQQEGQLSGRLQAANLQAEAAQRIVAALEAEVAQLKREKEDLEARLAEAKKANEARAESEQEASAKAIEAKSEAEPDPNETERQLSTDTTIVGEVVPRPQLERTARLVCVWGLAVHPDTGWLLVSLETAKEPRVFDAQGRYLQSLSGGRPLAAFSWWLAPATIA
jgi:seryl-tRNA synthetase